MIALLVRFFAMIDGFKYDSIVLIFTVIAIASMFIGNFLALRQRNVKRLLAYSSIAHMGYLMVAFLAGRELGVEAVSFYLVAYFITSVGAFGIVAMLSDKDRDAELVEDYQGLLWRRPWTAAAFAAMLLSLAGIPLTAGFVGKFYVIAAGVHTNLWLLVVMLAVNSALGLYYYIKIITAMFENTQDKEEPEGTLQPISYIVSGVTLSILVGLLLWVGVFPQWIMSVIRGYVNG
jgi:NADH-quinone oxidoreductase subunit N